MDYTFGISWKGILIFLLPMIPNIFYFLFPKVNVPGNAANKHLILDIAEHGSQAVFVFLLVFLLSKQDSAVLSFYTLGLAVILLTYFVLWIFFFLGTKKLMILLGLAILPVAYFILAEIWLHNIPAVIPTVIFGIIHTIITCLDYKKL